MSEWLRYCALGIAAAFFGFVLRSLGWSGAKVLSTVGVVGLAAVGVGVFGSLTDIFGSVSSNFGLGEVFKSVLKIVGIGYVFGISADVCRELGESGVAGAMTVVGRGSVLIAASPALMEIVSIAVGISGGGE